jgi:fructosamine-3-kinase
MVAVGARWVWQEMFESKTIRVPKPIVVGTSDNNAFVVFEYLPMGGSRGGMIGRLMGEVRVEEDRRQA